VIQQSQQIKNSSLKSRYPLLFISLILSLSLFLSVLLLYLLPVHSADNDISESQLMEKQRTMEKDLEQRVQGILDKILGPNQS
jgi:hypothetical protein